ncbi:LysM domain-containing protein [Isoptericola jiangsuensis]|uniref:LysM domain-containing protein n=1 Tax=Isoptericola jiangsuensis TaxID=548579 RepID=A0A2A9EX69_9MICO|nr:LysM peptidoglycan-binding domain-containing protein [Isoptericola jiangsuensis]PFG42825.1 LysM domain-containing protein [Isoptericola jiangsuensis]
MSTITAVPQGDLGPLGLDGLRLTVRGRVVLVLLALLAVAGGLLGGVQAVAGTETVRVEVDLHTVAPGETLWGFARTLVEPGEDVRDVVAELKALNGMRTSELRVGQVVALPAD